ncbi:MAG: hypothetical protein ACPGOY_00975 [Rhodospirillaceae bacterium]
MAPDDVMYFLHIPKTAGTSTLHYFVDVLPEDSICPHRIWDELMADPGADLASWQVFVGHFGGLFPLWLRFMPRMVTVLRNPMLRTLSHIKHVRRDMLHPYHKIARNVTIAEYCAHPVLSRTVENFQARYLASLAPALEIFKPRTPEEKQLNSMSVGTEEALYALSRGPDLYRNAVAGLEAMDAFGLADHHPETLRLFAAALDLPAPAQDYRDNRAPDPRAHGLELTPEDYAAMDAITEIDRAVYDHALRLFQKACRRHRIEIGA